MFIKQDILGHGLHARGCENGERFDQPRIQWYVQPKDNARKYITGETKRIIILLLNSSFWTRAGVYSGTAFVHSFNPEELATPSLFRLLPLQRGLPFYDGRPVFCRLQFSLLHLACQSGPDRARKHRSRLGGRFAKFTDRIQTRKQRGRGLRQLHK